MFVGLILFNYLIPENVETFLNLPRMTLNLAPTILQRLEKFSRPKLNT